MKAEKIYDYLNELQKNGEIQDWFKDHISCGVKGFYCNEDTFTITFKESSFLWVWFAESDVKNTSDIDRLIACELTRDITIDDVPTFPTGDN